MGELRVPLETQTEAWYLQCNKEIQDFFFFLTKQHVCIKFCIPQILLPAQLQTGR